MGHPAVPQKQGKGGVPEKTIQAILRHANVSTTNTYYT
jgi:integrase